MAEVTPRPAARGGRGSGRAGRGGHSSRASGRATSSRYTNGDAQPSESSIPLDEQGELGQLKKQYLTETVTLKEMFPDWTDDDLVFALQETDGDLQTTIERITEGNISRFADVKKKTREKSKPKAAEAAAVASSDKPQGSIRGRGRGGAESARGGRGRGSDRGGRGSVRGGRGGAPRTAVAPSSAPATDSWGESTATPSGGWGDSSTTATAAVAAAGPAADGGWGESNATAVETESAWDKPASTGAWGAVTEQAVNLVADQATTPTPEQARSSLIPEGTKKTWASMLSQPKPQPVLPKTAAAPAPSATSATDTAAAPVAVAIDETTEPATAHDHHQLEPTDAVQPTNFSAPVPSIDNVDLAPPKDDLTEENLEHLPDSSHPAATDTVISTRDPRSAVASTVSSAAPSHATAPQPIGRPTGLGGYATTALKATHAGRTASYNRRLLDQTEAVVLPKDHTVERTAVQFGSMGLGSDKPSDVDDEREEAETRTQPPQQSPAQPRASLPPVQQQAAPLPDGLRDTAATPKAAPGLPPVPQQAAAPLGQPPYGQYARYGAPGLSQEQGSAQKPYDPFAQQLNYPQGQSDSVYPAGQQVPSSVASQAPGQLAGTSLAQNDYASQYSTDHQRNAYQNYYGGSYGQHGQHGQQEHSHPPQRSGSNLGTSESGYGSQIGGAPSRFNESSGAGSGHNTPAPTSGSQQYGPGSQGGHVHQQSHNQHNAGYPQAYGNPYYGGSYYSNYMNQYPNQYGYGQQGYGQPYGGGKSGMYGQPHHGYGISPQASYDHSSSPGNVGGFGAASTSGGRDSGFSGSGFNDYSRSGSTQPSNAPSQPSGFGGGGSGSDGFARGNFGNHQATTAAEDSSVKAFHDNKTGPSPSLGQPGRTGSANTNPQSNFPPPGTHGFGAGGYPNHLNPLHSGHGSQQGGLGGLGGQYGGSAGFGGGAGAGGGGGGGGYGNQYGSYQRGWGGNYGGH